VAGHDFVSHPRIDPSGRFLSWLAWDHPRMPWDGTELWVADIDLPDGDGVPTVSGAEVVLGGPEISVAQPSWAPDGRLTAVADVDGWWNLWSAPVAGRPTVGTFEQTSVVEGELAQPQWVFGQSWYGHLPSGGVVGSWRFDGVDHLGVLAPGAATPRWLDVPWTSVAGLDVGADGTVAVVASSFSAEAVVATVTLTEEGGAGAEVEVVRPARELGVDASWWSVPVAIAFPTTGGRTAHALWYPPRNLRCEGPEGEAPPLLVLGHGGPTSAARPHLDLAVQYWTTRGWAVVDVNYGGSTGYGRPYRRQLDGAWGVVDVDDLCAAAAHLVERGAADPRRLAVKGSSAGGFTVLAALTFRDTFSVGASRYGIADLEALVADTHKFEVHYTDTLIAPYPEGRDRYVERSPIHHVESCTTPLLVLQGLEDAVVPPNQSEMIVAALEGRGVPVAFLAFEGEQHGFRRAETILRALEAEHYFFSEVLGLEPAEDLAPVHIRRPAGGETA
jgi:dienelactone hydrolase